MHLKFNTIVSNQTFQSFVIERSHISFKLNKKDIVAEIIMKETPKCFHCTLCLNLNGKEIVISKTSIELVTAIVSAVTETKLILRRSRMRISNLRKNRIIKFNEHSNNSSKKNLHASYYHFSLN